NAGQAIVNPAAAFPTTVDTFGRFPSSNQFWVSPDGNTILIADSRTDGNQAVPGPGTFGGGLLEYFQNGANNWLLVGQLALNNYQITSAVGNGTTVTITYSGGTGNAQQDFPANQSVVINGVGAGFNGTFTATLNTNNTFTYSAAVNGTVNPG